MTQGHTKEEAEPRIFEIWEQRGGARDELRIHKDEWGWPYKASRGNRSVALDRRLLQDLGCEHEIGARLEDLL
jgi:hypothetical protein